MPLSLEELGDGFYCLALRVHVHMRVDVHRNLRAAVACELLHHLVRRVKISDTLHSSFPHALCATRPSALPIDTSGFGAVLGSRLRGKHSTWAPLYIRECTRPPLII